jgi:hypothetical protein
MQLLRSFEQHLLRLNVIRIRDAAIDGAHRGTLFFLKMPYALRAFFRDDIVEIIGERIVHDSIKLPLRTAGIDGSIGALRFTGTTIDALLGYYCRHSEVSSGLK